MSYAPYTPLSRTFVELTPDEIAAVTESWQVAEMLRGQNAGWEEVLKSPRVVIVSEAGSGKTAECRQQAARLWADGQAAFFVELSELAQGKLSGLIDPDHEERFEAWRRGELTEATLFLDSIDELSLTSATLQQAIRNLRRELKDALHRLRVVITARPVPFDLAFLHDQLPWKDTGPRPSFAEVAMGDTPQADPADTPPTWRHVGLMPLNEADIHRFATDQDVTDPDRLLAALHDHDALEFIRRPQDLIELCAD